MDTMADVAAPVLWAGRFPCRQQASAWIVGHKRCPLWIVTRSCPKRPRQRIIEYPTTTPGASTLAYDPVSGTYSYVWKTDKAGAGTGRLPRPDTSCLP